MSSSGSTFEVQVDLLEHQVLVITTAGASRRVPLTARPVAAFYEECMAALRSLGIAVEISVLPSEVDNPIPFPEDSTHRAYDPTWVTRFFHVLSGIDLVFKQHRANFCGRTSLVQFFWGTFDLALARYSGRPAQPPAGAGRIYRLGGDAELICVGFWPGNLKVPQPAFFGYPYPMLPGIEQESIRPSAAHWNPTVGEFLLPYDDVRRASSPEDAILEFGESVYAACARLADWDPALVIARQPSVR